MLTGEKGVNTLMRIPAVTYNKYFKVYQPKRTAIADNTAPEPYPADADWGTLRILPKLSVANIRYQRDVYRQQVADFTTQAKDLHDAAGFFDKNAGADTAGIAGGIGRLVDTYNQFNDQLREAGNVTRRGENIFAGVEAMFTQRANDFRDVGITREQPGDRILLNEDKLTQALQANQANVESLFGGSAGVATLLQNTVRAVLADPVSAYLKEPNLLDSIDYGWRQNRNPFLYNSFHFSNQGLFLDMFV